MGCPSGKDATVAVSLDLSENAGPMDVVTVRLLATRRKPAMAIDVENLGRWYDAHSGPLLLYARQWLDEHAAADAVQEAFVKLASSREAPREVRPWLFRVVRNHAISEVRRADTRRRHRDALVGRQTPWFESPADEMLDARQAAEALRDLAPDQAGLVVMRIWGQMTFPQMAQVTGQSVSSVFSQYTAALERLRRKLVTPCKTNP